MLTLLLILPMMKVLNTSETSVNLYETTRCNVPGESFFSHRRENLKSDLVSQPINYSLPSFLKQEFSSTPGQCRFYHVKAVLCTRSRQLALIAEETLLATCLLFLLSDTFLRKLSVPCTIVHRVWVVTWQYNPECKHF
jgi:hypothetical protein